MQAHETRLFYAATGDGVARISVDASDDCDVGLSLEGSGAQCLAVDPHDNQRLYVGTFDDGLWRSLDGAETWETVGEDLPSKRFLSVALSPGRVTKGKAAVYAGSEPSNVYLSEDDGRTWTDFPTLTDVPSAGSWFFPPRPWTHHVRWIALHHSDTEVIYAGIELGGVLRSLDGGETWEDRKEGSYPDSHVVLTHSGDPERVYEAAGGGVAASKDRGATWQPVDEGMDHRYVWGLAVDPQDPDLWYVSAAPGPGEAHGGGRASAGIYRKEGDSPWIRLGGDGLPKEMADMPYALLAPAPEELIVGFHSGDLWRSTDRGSTWAPLNATLPRIIAMAR